MKCFYHEDRDAVATCQKCGKSLCKECTMKYKPIICEDCHQEEVREQEEELEQYRLEKKQEQENKNKSIRTKCIIGMFFAFFDFVIGSLNGPLIGFLSALFGFGIPFGFPAWFNFYDEHIAGRLDGIILILPILDWLFIILLKFAIGIYISYFIGPFVAAYEIFRYFKNRLAED